MVRENRVKETSFSVAHTGSNQVNTSWSYPVNGEIVAVEWKSANTGSIAVFMSGTNIEVFRRNAPSGASWQTGMPMQLTQTTTGSAAGYGGVYPWMVSTVLGMTCGSYISGTLTTDVVVKYR